VSEKNVKSDQQFDCKVNSWQTKEEEEEEEEGEEDGIGKGRGIELDWNESGRRAVDELKALCKRREQGDFDEREREREKTGSG
jgi:hypothetical protein